MQRLSGLDASFLYLETPSSHMHVAGLMILDPSSAEGGVTLEDVKAVYSERLHLAPPFRRRLVEVPFGLHHPLWVEDPDFDIDYHIRATALPSPGTPEQLSTLVGRLSALPLDRTRPLWEVWVIEGLEDGNVAVLSKVHHAAIDGASGNELTVALLDLTPEVAVHEPDEEWVPDHIPNEVELLTYALTSLARQPLRVVRALSKTTGAALAVRRRNREEPNLAPPPSPFSAPRTSFNTAISPRRSFAYTTVSLPTVKAVKNATGSTVNDVVLALCAGALRRYLDAHGEHPDAPLVAMVPVSVRTDDDKEMGNRVSSMFASLATDVDDPVERLKVIHECMHEVKEQQKAIGADTLGDWAEFAAPALAGTRGAPLLAHEDGGPPPAALQRHHLQRPRAAVPALLDRRAHGVQLPGRSDHGRRRAEHDGDELPRSARLRTAGLPRRPARRLVAGRGSARRRSTSSWRPPGCSRTTSRS